ncbi:hypothetical protein ACWEV3_21040 [Saccharopolyspora sp. NPDC003752]
MLVDYRRTLLGFLTTEHLAAYVITPRAGRTRGKTEPPGLAMSANTNKGGEASKTPYETSLVCKNLPRHWFNQRGATKMRNIARKITGAAAVAVAVTGISLTSNTEAHAAWVHPNVYQTEHECLVVRTEFLRYYSRVQPCFFISTNPSWTFLYDDTSSRG